MTRAEKEVNVEAVHSESSALTTLVRGLVDYAGLFPPAKLDMAAAVAEYARQLQGPDVWALGRFVVPVARLDELEAAAAELLPREAGADPWRLSVLVGTDPEGDRARVETFNALHRQADKGLAVVESIELKLLDGEQVGRVAELFAGFEIYFEIESREDPTSLMTAIARHGGDDVRAKIRTGGIVQEAIPEGEYVARFLATAARLGVTLKATAGLHHPLHGEYRLTYEEESPLGTMHGFLNLFLAAGFLKEGVIDQGEAVELLGERSASVFDFDGGEIRWRGHAMTAEALERVRHGFATSYGSCSFQEPLADLRSLGLLA